MKSLRAQLIVGSALIAVVPLAIALSVLSSHVRATIFDQATSRLSEALRGFESRLQTDFEAIEQRLAILAREPELRRLVLVTGNERSLSAYLDERRVLLGLDFLQVVDTTGANPAGDPVIDFPRLSSRRDASTPGLAFGTAGGAPRVFLSSRAPIEYQGERVAFLRGGMLIDSTYLERAREGSGVELALQDQRGLVAATLPTSSWPWPRIAAMPARGGTAHATSMAPEDPPVDVVVIADRAYWRDSHILEIGWHSMPLLIGLVPTAAADRTIAVIQRLSLALALAGVALAIALGFLWSSRVSRPVERLAADSRRLARGEWDAPIEARGAGELATLVESLDRMRRDLVDYRARLVASERHAAWSRMARAVAHEIKNPLTPIAISVADLRRSYDRNREDFPQILDQAARTVAEEVDRLQRILGEFARLGRFPEPVPAHVRLDEQLAALGALYGADVAAGRLALAPPEGWLTVWADADHLRQALVNLVQNALDATARDGHVAVTAVADGDVAAITVADDGPGLTDDQRARVFEPGFTTKPEGGGLGLTIVERIVLDHGGAIDVESAPGRGTAFTIRLPRAPRS